MSAPRYGAGRLVRRQLTAEPATATLVALTVLVVSLVLSLWPRAVDALLGEDLQEQVDTLTPAQRDLSGRIAAWFPDDPEPGALGAVTGSVGQEVDGAEQHAEWQRLLEDGRLAAGDELQRVLGAAEVVATRPPDPVEKGPRATDVYAENLAIRTDARIGERIRLVEGRAPAPYDATGLLDSTTRLEVIRGRPMEVMASADTAERMRWAVGETRAMTGVIPFRVTLVGTFEAVDPASGHWSHLESTLVPHVVEDGNVGTTVNGVAYADPSALGALVLVDGVAVDFWYTTLTAEAATTDRAALLRELRAFLPEQRMSSELTARLEDVGERHATFTGLLQVLAVGPVGVALAVLWLAATLATERRRGALVLAAARGASRSGVRWAMAVQGLAVGVLPAVVGAWAAAVVVPRPVATLGAAVWALPAVVGLAPAVFMAVTAGPAMRGGPAVRADARRPAQPAASGAASGRAGWRAGLVPSGASGRPLRLGLELAVVGLAAFAAWTARQRGLTGAGAAAAGTDPLLLAGPVLLAVAGGLLALRVYPAMLRALTRSLHTRRGLAHFVGAAEAARSARAGLAAVVALVLAVGIAVFSGVALSTVRGGVERSAAAAVGADLVLDGVGLPADAAARILAFDGVAHAATVGTAGEASGRLLGSDGRVEVITVDADDVTAVQAGLPGLEPLPRLTGRASGSTAPGGTGSGEDVAAVVGGRDAEDVDADAETFVRWGPDLTEVPLAPVAAVRSLPGVATGSSWVVVDAATWVARTGTQPAVARVLVDLAPGADAAEVAAAARLVLGDDGVDRPGMDAGPRVDATTIAEVRASAEERALVRGLAVGLLAAAGLSALLAGVVLVLSLMIRGPERGRLVSLLATVGAPRGTTWRLVAWEVVPLVATTLLVGAGVGALLPWVVLAGADLRPFTGGLARPPITVTTTAALVVLGTALVTSALAVAVASARARRTPTAVVLREGERP